MSVECLDVYAVRLPDRCVIEDVFPGILTVGRDSFEHVNWHESKLISGLEISEILRKMCENCVATIVLMPIVTNYDYYALLLNDVIYVAHYTECGPEACDVKIVAKCREPRECIRELKPKLTPEEYASVREVLYKASKCIKELKEAGAPIEREVAYYKDGKVVMI